MVDAALRYEDFEPHVGSDFTLVDLDRILNLAEAKPLTVRADAPDARKPFSLLFTGPGDVLEQQIHRFRHGAIGDLDIFIVPIMRVADGIQYEAVFN